MSDKTDGLLAQHHLLLSIIHTEWATRLDHKVAAVIIERYFSKFGNSRASLRYLADRTGATRANVIASVRRLTDRAVFHVIREGAGTRPTEFGLNFHFSASGIVDDTSTSGIADDTSTVVSGIADNTKTSLTVTGLQAGLHERDIEPAPASPPLSTGLSAVDAGSAGGGFEELWRAYGHRQKKADAKAAYAKAAPDADLHERMVAAAKAWFGAWAAQGKAEAPRFTLAKWIEREEFECDPPTAFKPKERKAKPAAASEPPEPANDNIPDWMRGSPKLWPVGRHEGEFIEGEVVKQGGDTEVRMTFRRDDGKLLLHHFYTEAFIKAYQTEGQAALRDILSALRMDTCEDTDEILFKPLAVEADGETLWYRNIDEAA